MSGWSVSEDSFSIIESDFTKIVFTRPCWLRFVMIIIPAITCFLLFFSYSFYTGIPAKGGGVEVDPVLAGMFFLICILLLPLNLIALKIIIIGEKYEINRTEWALFKNGKRVASIDEIQRISVTASSRLAGAMDFWSLQFKLEDGRKINASSFSIRDLEILGEQIAPFVGMSLHKDF